MPHDLRFKARRDGIRAFARSICVVWLCVYGLTGQVEAQEALYLIRHGEKELSGADPAITPEGRQRAADWAALLKSAGVDMVYTSDALRTWETGNLIAEILDLPVSSLPRTDTAGLVDAIGFDHEEDVVLIVGHRETIPSILAGFGMPNNAAIDPDDFGSLFILWGVNAGDPSLLRLHMP